MKQIDIDLNELPEDIGRNNNGRRDYRFTDVPAILHWISTKMEIHNNMCVVITGMMPAWLAMDIAVAMYENDEVAQFGYVTPSMIDNGIKPKVIFPRNV